MTINKRILVVEDDPFQADSIRRVLTAVARRANIEPQIITATSEHDSILKMTGADVSPYDLYVVDLMLPWCQLEDTIPDPDETDPEVRKQGPLKAGFRVVRRLRESLPNEKLPPVILYTIANSTDPHEFIRFSPEARYLTKGEDDQALAELAVGLLTS